jgi:hypothetical protein
MVRPLKAAEPDAQTTVSLRMPGTLRMRLEREAAANHRTLSSEAERRLERSFSPDLMLDDTVYMVKSTGSTLQPEEIVRAVARAVYGRHADIAIDILNALVAAEMAAKQGAVFKMSNERTVRIVDAVRTITNDISNTRNVNKSNTKKFR